MITHEIVIINKAWNLQFHKVLKLRKWEALDNIGLLCCLEKETWNVLHLLNADPSWRTTASQRNHCH
jgi:hypothetical protein